MSKKLNNYFKQHFNYLISDKTADTIYDQLKLVYQECIWQSPSACLVILDNLDLLIENKAHAIDPSSQLYHAQIVECNEYLKF